MLTARQNISRYTCPSCGTDRVRRAHRQGILERIVSMTANVYPYHCLECPGDIRFHRFKKR
jgi:predicted RNA-binding Zn-ribbon protein involved in translation (DUF1610 family)